MSWESASAPQTRRALPALLSRGRWRAASACATSPEKTARCATLSPGGGAQGVTRRAPRAHAGERALWGGRPSRGLQRLDASCCRWRSRGPGLNTSVRWGWRWGRGWSWRWRWLCSHAAARAERGQRRGQQETWYRRGGGSRGLGSRLHIRRRTQHPGGFSIRLEQQWEVAGGLSRAVTWCVGRFGVLVLFLVEAYLVLPTFLVSAKHIGVSGEENFPSPLAGSGVGLIIKLTQTDEREKKKLSSEHA